MHVGMSVHVSFCVCAYVSYVCVCACVCMCCFCVCVCICIHLFLCVDVFVHTHVYMCEGLLLENDTYHLSVGVIMCIVYMWWVSVGKCHIPMTFSRAA